VFFTMVLQFNSLFQPLLILIGVFLALGGVFWGLLIVQTQMSIIMTGVGIIALAGVVAKNGIVLIDYTTLLEERGIDVVTASVMAAKSRLRPILMTTLTTVFGMVPLAIGRGEGAEMWNSLGVTVAWGLSVSTLITLLLIPVLYCSFETRKVRRQQKKLAMAKTEE